MGRGQEGPSFTLRSSLAPGTLPMLLTSIYLGRRTGMLLFNHGEERCGLRFVRGHVVYGEASAPDLHMGEVMVAEGLLTPETLAQATDRVVNEQRRLGQVLIAMGFVDLDLLEESLALHVRHILVRILSWRDGRYTFEEQDPEIKLEHDFPLKRTTGAIVLDAVRSVTDRDSVLFGIGPLDRILVPSSEPLLLFRRIELTPIDGFVLSRVDGTLTASDVMRVTPLAADVVAQSLLSLLCIGILEVTTDKPKPSEKNTVQFLRQEILDTHASLGRRGSHELLGVSADAQEPEIKAAYLRLAKRYHPDVHHDSALSDLQDKLEAIFSAIGQAYETLRRTRRAAPRVEPARAPPAAPEIPPAPVEAVPIEDIIQRAEERLAEGRHWEAVALLQEVLGYAQGRLRRRARVGLARVYAQKPDALRHAERELQGVLQDDPEDVEAAYLLGCLYQKAGLVARASAMLRRVVELKPAYADANARLQALAPGSEAGPEYPGLFDRIFGKRE